MKKLFLSFFLILFVSTSAFGEVKKQTYGNGYYIGEINSNNQRHGYGIYLIKKNNITKKFGISNRFFSYEGEWRNGKFHGRGIAKYYL